MPSAKKMNQAQKHKRNNALAKSASKAPPGNAFINSYTGELLKGRKNITDKDFGKIHITVNKFIQTYQSKGKCIHPLQATKYTEEVYLNTYGVELKDTNHMFSEFSKQFLSGKLSLINGKLNGWHIGNLGSTWCAWTYKGQDIRVCLGSGEKGYKYHLEFVLPENSSSLPAAMLKAKAGQTAIHITTSHDGQTKTYSICCPPPIPDIPWNDWVLVLGEINKLINSPSAVEDLPNILKNPIHFVAKFLESKM